MNDGKKPVRVVHYINQFFGGLGAEDKADLPPQSVAKPVGPGLLLEKLLDGSGHVVGTLICGDNYFVENEELARRLLFDLLKPFDADVLVAGPAFNSGRYGTACASLCLSAQRELNMPAVTGMARSNPGVDICRSEVLIVPTGITAVAMRDAMPGIARLAARVGQGRELGSASDEGYLPRGERRNVDTGLPASERAVDLLVKKLRGLPAPSELVIEPFETVPPPEPVRNLASTKVALVTESGLVPAGNPDHLETWNSSKWFKYPIAGRSGFAAGEYEGWHGGYNTQWVNEDPDRVAPLDALRTLEKEGFIATLHDYYYVTTGNMASIATMERIGAEIAQDLKAAAVGAVLLTAT